MNRKTLAFVLLGLGLAAAVIAYRRHHWPKLLAAFRRVQDPFHNTEAAHSINPPGQPLFTNTPPNQMRSTSYDHTAQTIQEINRINRMNQDQRTPSKKPASPTDQPQ